MGRFKSFIGALSLIAAVCFLWVGVAGAHSFRSGTNVTVGQNEKIDNTIFVAARTVDINSEVNGDIFCAGQTVTISGTVHGDVICAGQTVNVTGTIDGDVRLAGQTVTIGAKISGNATVAGQSFNLESTGDISGDITIGSSDAILNGPIGRDIAMGGNSLIIANKVGRDVKASINKLELTSGANVVGSIDYTSSQQANISDQAKVGGEVTRSEPTKPAASKHWAIFGFGVGWFIYWFIAMLLIAMAFALLFPRVLKVVTDQATPKPWKALLTGFLAHLAVPFILLLVAITIVGIPLALILGLLWFVVFLLSGPLFGFYLGRLILRKPSHTLLTMFIGSSVLLILYFIPLLGVIALLAATWIGSGMLVLEIFKRVPKPKYQIANDNKKNSSK